MRSYLLVLPFIVLMTACSQDEKEQTTNKAIEKHIIEKKVTKSPNKKEALVCLDADEKITCKLMTKRVNSDREVEFAWESPNGKDNRERKMTLPANHASVYDARLKKGRAKGLWKVEVEIDDEEVSTTFNIQ